MLFLIFVIMLVGGIVLACCASEWGYNWEWLVGLSAILGAIAIIAVLGSCVIMGVNHIGADAEVDQLNVRYETLVYQYENDIYDNDNDLGKRELMVDIQEWNENQARRSKLQDNFWVGIYYPNIYDQFKPVELK